MFLAVLEKRLGMVMGTKDVFVNLVGGLRISDPTADLAVIMAIASSAKDIIIPQDTVLVGEVGLTGEVRSVANLDKRVAETEALGFKQIIVPQSNLKRFKKSNTKIKVLGVSSVKEVFSNLF